ncbi:unnamed protein product [Rhizophagus irregularis]|uniref:Uncharacterized protein n=1 Tax=Rhizophagus irregularis TaxID=588596 RepID=A0A915Z2W4_9GLOM|nr:unnamed protein product [Rhizophagus irregularis]
MMEGVEDYDETEKIIIDDDAYLLEFWNKMVDDKNIISIEELIVSSSSEVGEKDRKSDEELLKLIFERRLSASDNDILNPVRLHLCWWENSSSILAELTLAQISPHVIKQFDTETDENKLLETEFEKHLVEQVIRDLLNRIIYLKEEEKKRYGDR